MDHLLRESNNTVSYLTNLTNQLHDDFSVEYRHEGAPLHPDETFFLKKVPRDLSWMQINLLRQQGFAARLLVATIILTWKNLYMNYMLG
jgi:hypothetical protein